MTSTQNAKYYAKLSLCDVKANDFDLGMLARAKIRESIFYSSRLKW